MGLLDHLAVREIGNGIWFIVCAEMILFFLLYMFSRAWSYATGKTWIVFRAKKPEGHPWWLPTWVDFPLQVASGFSFYLMGSGLRAGWVWMYMHCANGAASWCWMADHGWVLWLAIVFGVVGGTCLIRLFSPPQWRPWSVIGCIVVAVVVPVVFYFERFL